MGFNSPVGSGVNQGKKLLILTQFEEFWQHFSMFVEKNRTNDYHFDLAELKNKIMTEFFTLTKCSTN